MAKEKGLSYSEVLSVLDVLGGMGGDGAQMVVQNWRARERERERERGRGW